MRAAIVIVMGIWFMGCQSLGVTSVTRDLSEGQFLDLWRVYEHCRVSHDVRAIGEDADRLSQAALADEGRAMRLPEMLARWVEPPPVRRSVEPKAMAASCALRGGQVAWQSGHPEMAQHLFSLVVRRFHEAPLAFYVSEASAGLAVIASAASSSPIAILVKAR
ncbi:MAG: hypothetical protein HZB35_02375 [Nitrospirae bacterium]|nr:hypothetical protein [Nitrospirota bacterium]